MKKLTTEQWIEKARVVHGDRYDYSKVEYKGADEKVCIICHEKDENGIEHGEFWQRAANHITLKRGCPKCAENIKYTTEEFIEKANKVHNNKYDYSKVEYINSKTPISIICPKHGEFKQTPLHHLSGEGCPICSREKISELQRKTTKEFIIDAKKIHGTKYDYSKVDYHTSRDKVCIICQEHGEFWQLPYVHTSGCGCPKCYLKSQTKLYEKLKESFPNEEILFEVNNETVFWIKNQRFDIYFPKYNIAVEYNGKQHYVPINLFGGQLGFEDNLWRDELKRKKCKENNCYLFEVRYDYTKKDYQKLVENIQNIINNYDSSVEI